MQPQTLRHVISSRVINHELISSQGKGGARWAQAPEQKIQKALDKWGIRQESRVLSLQCSCFSRASSLQLWDFSCSSCRINSAACSKTVPRKETATALRSSHLKQTTQLGPGVWRGNCSHYFKPWNSWWPQGSSSQFPQLGVVFSLQMSAQARGYSFALPFEMTRLCLTISMWPTAVLQRKSQETSETSLCCLTENSGENKEKFSLNC